MDEIDEKILGLKGTIESLQKENSLLKSESNQYKTQIQTLCQEKRALEEENQSIFDKYQEIKIQLEQV